MSGGPAVNDRGLAYGDGLFETVRVTASGAAPLWPRHQARLLAGAARLRIPVAPDPLDRYPADATTDEQPGPGQNNMLHTRGHDRRGDRAPAPPTPELMAPRAPRHGAETMQPRARH